MGVIDIGSRVEMLVDDYLVEATSGLDFRLNQPVEREVAITGDRPWEGPGSFAYATVFAWKGMYHLYYRATAPGNTGDTGELQYLCYARSADGVHWEKPALGLFEYGGSTANNIVLGGEVCHNFTPVLDTNPACPESERIKAAAGYGHALYVYGSADGLRFHRLSDEPAVASKRFGFDSQNVLFYDDARGVYRIYSRYFKPSPFGVTREEGVTVVRAIQMSESKDCLHWSAPVPNEYTEGADEQFYTNAVTPCPGAEHVLLSLPMRFAEERARAVMRGSRGVSDAVFMTSRDGHLWDRRHMDSLIGGGLDERGWTQRCNIPARGLLRLGDELSLYVQRRYCWEDASLVRFTMRPFGFSSLHAGAKEGELRSKPFVFSGDALRVNFSTAATGSARFALTDPDTGAPYAGFSFEDCEELFGDALDEAVRFAGGPLTALSGRPVVLQARLRLGNLYSFRFGEADAR